MIQSTQGSPPLNLKKKIKDFGVVFKGQFMLEKSPVAELEFSTEEGAKIRPHFVAPCVAQAGRWAITFSHG